MPTDPVPVEYFVHRDNHQIVRNRLSDQHSIEGIAVRTGEPSGAFGMPDGNRQLFETLTGDAACDVAGNRPAARQLAQPALGGNLPSRSRTYQDVIRIVFDRPAGRPG